MDPVIVVGIGEMGGVFARGLLRAGRPVVPVVRATDPAAVAAEFPRPDLVLVAVAEDDLDAVLASLPGSWHDRVGLLQNELLPRTWERHGLVDPTVAVVWFEKKPGRDVQVIVPTPVVGPASSILVDALDAVGIAAAAVPDTELVPTLVAKNLYILVSNLAGLRVGGTVGELWGRHRDLALAVAQDVLALQEAMLGGSVDRGRALAAMAEAFAADPEHAAMGRSAPRRLSRALRHADELGVEVPTLRSLAAEPRTA